MQPRLVETVLRLAILPGLVLGAGLILGTGAGASEVDPVLTRADQRTGAGDLRGAMMELKSGVAARPEAPDLRARLGLLYLELGDGAGAEKELQRAIELGKADFQLRLQLARARLLQGKAREVITDPGLDAAATPQDKAAARVLKGLARLDANESAGAQTEFQAALTELPRYAPAYLGLARVQLQASDLTGAQASLREAAGGLEADEAEILTLRGDLAMARREFADAQGAYEGALKLRPHRVLLTRSLAGAQVAQGRFPEAEANLRPVLAAAPRDPQALYLKAITRFAQKDYAQAAEGAQAVLNQTVASAPVLYLAGASAFNLGHFEQAREHLGQYHGLQPEDGAGARLLGATLIRLDDPAEAYRVLMPLVSDQSREVSLLAAVGTVAVQSGRAAAGLGYLERALAAAPTDSGLKALVAAAQRAVGDPRALAELTRLALADPALGGLAYPVAANLLADGELTAALTAAEHFRQTRPEDARAWTLQAVAQVRGGDLAAAQASFRKALALDPKATDAQTGLADIQYRRGDVILAIAGLEQILAAHPDDRRTLINLAGIEDAAGQGGRAVKRLVEALAVAPGDPTLSAALARIHLRHLRPMEALDLLARVPQDPRVLAVRGQAELAGARTESALITLKRLVDERPNAIEGRLLLARAYQRAGDWPAARKEIDAALAQAPHNLEVRLAMVRGALADPGVTRERAEAMAATLRELDPRDPRVTELRGRLAAQLQRRDEALALLQAAHAALNTSDTVQALADILFAQGQRAQAVALLDDWLNANPQDNNARLGLAQLDLITGDYPRAAENLSAALGQHAEGEGLESALAWALAAAGRTDEAAPLAEAALRRSAADVFAAQAQALVELARDRPARAVAVLKPLMSGDAPRSARIQLDYARALVGAKDPAGARAALDRLLATSPADAPERAEALALLGRLPR